MNESIKKPAWFRRTRFLKLNEPIAKRENPVNPGIIGYEKDSFVEPDDKGRQGEDELNYFSAGGDYFHD